MTRPPLFVELCAGLASMSLMLQHGKHCKPPVSRMGNKHGYALAILRVMGLRPGQRADAFLWCEPDAGCRALLHAYTDPALMREAADIIRGWKDEDPRALWERLRAEGPIRDFGARECARWQFVWSKNLGNKAVPMEEMYFDSDESRAARGCYSGTVSREALAGRLDDHAHASELARYLQVTASNRLINIDSTTMQNSGKGGTTFGGDEFATGAGKVADAAREVARWAFTTARQGKGKGGVFVPENDDREGRTGWQGNGPPRPELANRCDRATGLPATIAPDAREITPPTLPPGCVAYCDPPYRGTTGYGNDLPRTEVVELARRWADAGAAVYVSEAEPIPELVEEGWHTVEITSTRVGQKRTFSKQKREWLTMNRPPAWVPPVQESLF